MVQQKGPMRRTAACVGLLMCVLWQVPNWTRLLVNPYPTLDNVIIWQGLGASLEQG